MAQQRSTAPRTKPAWLTRVTAPGAPVVTYAIIAVCVVVFLLQNAPIVGGRIESALIYAGGYSHPTGSLSPLIAFEPWRMLTSLFAHASLIHLALNMYTLWVFGIALEPMLGRLRYAALFLIAGFAGSLAVLLITPPGQGVLGASGAIFGMFGAFFIIQRRLGGNATQILTLVAINLAIGFIPGLNISWQAHIGGFIGGLLLGLIYVETSKPSRRRWQLSLTALLCALLIAVSLLHFF
ncbi:rhomboid family protein [Leifsonia xyli subsp. xyli]|nr:rhomboid family protein [Leifsonia xyli subsp. xyli]